MHGRWWGWDGAFDSLWSQAIHPLRNPREIEVIAEVARMQNATIVVGAASTFPKDILPRAAALLDAGMISDVIEVRPEGTDFVFKRVMYAGNVVATVKLDGDVKFLTIRAAAFAPPAQTADFSPVMPVAVNLTRNAGPHPREARACEARQAGPSRSAS